MERAAHHLDTVVDSGTKDYAIVITLNPEPEFPCYGVRNKQTRVDEYLSSNLPKARFLMQELQKDMDHGIMRDTDDGVPPRGGSGPARPTSGLNG